MSRKTIGIDLGTTYSLVAHAAEGGLATILPGADGSDIVPSVVHFGRDLSFAVGADAKARLLDDPGSVVTGIKRHMGDDFLLRYDGLEYTPEAVSALILRRLATNASHALGVAVGELDAVVTVPAYFGVREREATREAARLADLSCLGLLDEPVAAAYAYRMHADTETTCLVYDLGGGTFDATVVNLSGDQSQVWAVDGAPRLGGLDWDERLAHLIVERYLALCDDPDALSDEDFLDAVTDASERAKRKLSRREDTTLQLRRNGKTTAVQVTRPQFEQATQDLLAESIDVVKRVVTTATELGAPHPSEILLVGGSTRMPMVQAALERHLDVPVRISDPERAVARGAALFAHRSAMDNPGSGRAIPRPGNAATIRPMLRPVVSRAVGVKIHDSTDPSGTKLHVEHLVQANTPLPVTAHSTFATVLNGQDRVRIEIFEQAGPVRSDSFEHNRPVLDGELIGLPKLSAGSPVEVMISLGEDGRLSCTAVEPVSGAELKLESYIVGVIDEYAAARQAEQIGRLQMLG